MRSRLIAAAAAALIVLGTAAAADPCAEFKWDVAKEHSLFGGAGEPLTAGKDVASAPMLATDRLYELRLEHQDQVSFAASPGKKTLADQPFAGVAALKVKTPGSYRVSVDAPLWIDVVADGKITDVKDFQGQKGCDAPHKIVEFELAAAQQFVLQVSGSIKPSVRVTVTRAQ
jgi:hypothetical protein